MAVRDPGQEVWQGEQPRDDAFSVPQDDFCAKPLKPAIIPATLEDDDDDDDNDDDDDDDDASELRNATTFRPVLGRL